ncbi:cytochrome c peroxidase [Lacibacterium aquatile]|uniref:Cytochrome c peroxidase n=1 Tax=Lacibacterium aquatile TaxID=1168082 RepID=A0ABW5DMR3_9PROT
MGRVLLLFAGLMLAALPAAAQTPWQWRLPRGEAPPSVPVDNPLSVEKVELGRKLFYDVRLSGPGYMSCATCHDQERAFTDRHPRALGVSGERHPRNVQSLVNVAYYPVLTWSDPTVRRLEEQLFTPLFGGHPVEMGGLGREDEILGRLKADPEYPAAFAAAFPDGAGAISWRNVGRAIASFERTLVSFDSTYDRQRRGEGDLPEDAKRGRTLFFGPHAQCGTCHGGRFLTDFRYHPPQGDTSGATRVRTPSLRNVERTAPYFHDGAAKTLSDVLSVHAAGARLSTDERADLEAFLRTLTDQTVLADPLYANPYR